MLVRSDPCPALSAIDGERAERVQQYKEIVEQVKAAIDESRKVHLERIGIQRGKFWYVAGHRVDANSLHKTGEGRGQRRTLKQSLTIDEALQCFATELDSLYSKGPDAPTSTSTESS